MTKFYIVDEERLFSDIVAAAARVQGYEPLQFFDASSAYQYFKDEEITNSTDLFWVDMYLLPGPNPQFQSTDGDHDEYRVGLKLASRIISERIVLPSKPGNLTLYSGHITKGLWNDINKFCDQHSTNSFQKRAGTEFPELMDRIPQIENEDEPE